MCRSLLDYGPPSCAINATGGYKAQTAVAVMLGQALGTPVYYKHEQFDQIIAFPPLPFSLDLELWLEWSGLFYALEAQELVSAGRVLEEGELDRRLDPLVEQVRVDGTRCLALSAAGIIYHQTFAHRFPGSADRYLPSPAQQKQPPQIDTDHSWKGADRDLRRWMKRVTDEVPYVIFCKSCYYHPSWSIESPRGS